MPIGFPRKSKDAIEYVCIECRKIFYRNHKHVYKFCSTTCNYKNKKGKKQPYIQGVKISQSKLAMGLTGSKSHMYGTTRSGETRKKISKGNKGKIKSKESIEKMLKSRGSYRGENNPNFGKTTTEKTRKLISEGVKKHFRENKSSRDHYPTPAGKGRTAPEKTVASILNKLGIEFTEQFALEDRRYDFYIPANKLLIEVDGTYWHCKYNRDKPNVVQQKNMKNDLYKNQLAEDHGFEILRLWEDELVDCEEVINGKVQDRGM